MITKAEVERRFRISGELAVSVATASLLLTTAEDFDQFVSDIQNVLRLYEGLAAKEHEPPEGEGGG